MFKALDILLKHMDITVVPKVTLDVTSMRAPAPTSSFAHQCSESTRISIGIKRFPPCIYLCIGDSECVSRMCTAISVHTMQLSASVLHFWFCLLASVTQVSSAPVALCTIKLSSGVMLSSTKSL